MKIIFDLVSTKGLYLFTISFFISTFSIAWNWFLDNAVTSIHFVALLFILISIDAVTGSWKHIKLNNFDWTDLCKGFLTKLMISGMGIATFNLIVAMDSTAAYIAVTDYLLLLGKLMLLIYVGGSAFTNMYVITDGKFPPKAFMIRLKKFEETLDPNDLKNK